MPQTEHHSTRRKGSTVKARKAAPVTAEDVLASLSAMAAESGSVTVRISDVARHFGKPRSTVSGWLNRWAKQGRLAMTPKGRDGLEISFPRKASGPLPVTLPDATGEDAAEPSPGAEAEAVNLPGLDAVSVAALDTPKATPSVVASLTRKPAEVVSLPATQPVARRTRKRHRSSPVPALALPVTVAPDHLADVGPTHIEPLPALPSTPALRETPRPAAPARLPFFRDANALRLLAIAAAGASIVMVAWHAASADAENAAKWSMVLFVALVTATAKPILGLVAGNMRADGDASGARIAAALGLLALMIDASILFAFRGEGLANRAAIDAAAEAARTRIIERLDLLRAERKRLTGIEAEAVKAPSTAPATRLPGEIRPLIAALDEGADPKGPCRWVTPRRTKRNPHPEKRRADATRCDDELAKLRSELARADASERAASRGLAEVEARRERLASLPGLIEAAERELAERQARGSTDGGASQIARGLNWVPAGLASALFGIEDFRPVEPDGVLTGLTWGFVLVIELLALYGLALASRRDRALRKRLGFP